MKTLCCRAVGYSNKDKNFNSEGRFVSYMAFMGFTLGVMLTAFLMYFLISVFIGGVLLHLATVILNFQKRSLGTAVAVVIVGGIVAFIFGFIPAVGWILGLIAYWYFIKSFYSVGWGKAILAWAMSILVAFIITILVILLLGISIFLF